MGSFETKAQTLQQRNRTDLEVLSVTTRPGTRRQSSQQTGCSLFYWQCPRFGLYSCYRNNFKSHDL